MGLWRGNQPWWQQGSFVEPVVPPEADPADEPQVCISINKSWVPYVIGALLQLVQPSSWRTSDPAVLSATLTAATELIESVGTAGGCMIIRWSPDDCAIQISTDAGDTWSDISGWDLSSVQGCILDGLVIRVDSGGNFQWSIDGGTTWTNVDGWIPPAATIVGQTTSDKACSIASYLANDVIQMGITQSVDSYNNAHSTLQNFANISDLLIFFEPELPLLLNAITGLYGLYTAGTIANLTAASTNAGLFTFVRCAIYGAIVADGDVTEANFADIQTALAAITYPDSDTSNAIQGFVDDLGLNGFLALQVAAPYAVGDCTSCGNVCALFNGTDDVIVGATDVLTGGAAFVMGGFIETASTAHIQTLFQIGYNGSDPRMVAMWLDTSGHLQADVRGNDAVDHLIGYTGANLADGNPHHVMIFCNGASGYSIYVDGTVRNTSGAIPTSLNGSGAVSRFGFGLGGGTGHMVGKMWGWGACQHSVTGGALTSWAALPYTYPATMTHTWPMAEGSGSTVADTTGTDTGTWSGTGTHWSSY